MREAAEVAHFAIDASYDRSLLKLEDNRRMAQLHLQTNNPIHNMLNDRSRLIPREVEPGYYRGGPFSSSSVSIPSHFDLERELEGLAFPQRRIQPPKRLALTDAPVPPLSLPAGSSNDGVDVPVPTTPPRSPRAEAGINRDSDLKKKLLKLLQTI